MGKLPALCVAAWLVLAGVTAAAPGEPAADWPQFRGPNGSGISPATHLPLTWSESRNILWKTPLPGRGHSSPVVLGDRVWLTTAYETLEDPPKAKVRLRGHPTPRDVVLCSSVRLSVICLGRETGKILYETELFRVDQPGPSHKYNSFATPTPALEPGRVYCDFGAMGTACVEAESGKVLWRRTLVVEHTNGPGSSPVLCKDLLILVRDGTDEQYVAALDKNAGRTVWKTDRPAIQADAQMKKSYCTPLIVRLRDGVQAVIPAARYFISYDPANGKELWRVQHGGAFSTAPVPVYGNGMVYACTGCPVGQLWAIRTDPDPDVNRDRGGDVAKTHVAWKASDQIPTMSSPLVVGKEVYTVSDNGMAFCRDAMSGEVLWRYRLSGRHLASPTWAEGRVYFCGRDGTTVVLQAGREARKLAENKLDSPVTASPAPVGNSILLRTDTHLYCIGNR